MRTTLDIDDDVLDAAKSLAKQRKVSVGRVLSDLVRKALTPESLPKIRNGFPVVERPAGSRIHSMEFVNELRDER